MHSRKFVFSRVVEWVPHWEFQRIARRHSVDSSQFGFLGCEHFYGMMRAPLTFPESLRCIAELLPFLSVRISGHKLADLAEHLSFV
jgi:hypothetical protein